MTIQSHNNVGVPLNARTGPTLLDSCACSKQKHPMGAQKVAQYPDPSVVSAYHRSADPGWLSG
jgi:hypothetical protein